MKKFYVGIKGVVRDQTYGIILLHREYKSGDFWDTPGGRIDADEDFKATLTRELDEELPGIQNIKIGKLLGAHRVQKDIDGDISLVLLYFLVDAKLPDPVQISDEHESYTWLKKHGDLPSGLNPEIKKILEALL
jgi:8-oxo-dGTP pyrophosphatase MutT (NUDIX family)